MKRPLLQRATSLDVRLALLAITALLGILWLTLATQDERRARAAADEAIACGHLLDRAQTIGSPEAYTYTERRCGYVY